MSPNRENMTYIMNTKRFLFLSALFLLGGIIPLKANPSDSSNVFTLEEALLLASDNNHEILKSLAEVKAAKADNQQANAAFLPAIELSNSFSSTNDPLYAFGFKLQQQNVSMADFDPNVVNSPGTIDHFNTQVLVEQPLVNLDAWMGKSAAQHKLKATELKSEYTREYVQFLVKQTYYALQLAINRVEVIQKAKSAIVDYLKVAEDNLQQGYLKEADVLTIKVRMYELQAQEKEAEGQVKSVGEMLNFLLGRETHLPIQTTSVLQQVDYAPVGLATVANRSDVLAMQSGTEAYKQMERSSLMKFAPRINAFGTYNLYDSQFPGTDVDSWMVGVKLQWRIFNGGQNLGKYQKSKAEFHHAQLAYNEYLDKGNMELVQARRQITVAESQLFTYEMAAQQAGESLRIRINRFEQGLERTSDLLMAEAKSAESALKHLNAIYNFNVAVFKYQLLASESSIK